MVNLNFSAERNNKKEKNIVYNDRPLSEIITVINVVEKFEMYT